MKLRVFIAALLICTSAGAAEQKKQPAERLEQRRAYIKKVMVDSYDLAGDRNPKWDAQARALLAARAAQAINDPLLSGEETRIILSMYREAMKAGCTDAVVRFYGADALGATNAPKQFRTSEQEWAAGKLLEQTRYPAYVRAHILLDAAWCHTQTLEDGNPTWRRAAQDHLDEAMKILPRAFADADIPPELVMGLVNSAGALSKSMEKDRMVLVRPVVKLLKDSPRSRSLMLTALADEMIKYAWDARGSGWAQDVDPEMWKPFKERIASARSLLQEAWDLDDQNREAAQLMIVITMAENQPRHEMEKWFKRAMDLDPWNRRACINKIEYLRPAWCGSVQELADFGHELMKDANHGSGIPILLERIHWDIAWEAPGARNGRPDVGWFAQPEVWEDLSAMYDGYLKLVPGSRAHRTSYMLAAAWSGHWDVAQVQLNLLDPEGKGLPKADAMVAEVVREIRQHAAAE